MAGRESIQRDRGHAQFLTHLAQTLALKAYLCLSNVPKDGSDSEDFLFREFRIERERQTLLTQAFSDRQVTRLVT